MEKEKAPQKLGLEDISKLEKQQYNFYAAALIADGLLNAASIIFAAALIADGLLNAASIIFAAALLLLGNTVSLVCGISLFFYVVLSKGNMLTSLGSIFNTGVNK